MADLSAIDPRRVDEYWPAIANLIERAMSYSNFDAAGDVYQALKEQKAYLWIIHTDGEINAAVVAQLKIDKHGKVGTIWACGGHGFREWVHLISGIEAWAALEGCTRMRLELRPGWVRIMKRLGYRITHATIEKAI